MFLHLSGTPMQTVFDWDKMHYFALFKYAVLYKNTATKPALTFWGFYQVYTHTHTVVKSGFFILYIPNSPIKSQK